MKISVAWESDTVTAHDLVDKLSTLVRTPLLAEPAVHGFNMNQKLQRLSYETVNYGEGNVVAAQIVMDLAFDHGIHAKIWINGQPLGCYIYRLEQAVLGAIESLKKTRGWLRDHRIAEIRRELERVF